MRKPNARDRILEAAGQLFHKHGYSNVGINEIIKEAESAKASFYQHFESKEALCEAWLEKIHDRSEGWRNDIIKSDKTALEKLNRCVDELAEYLVESDFRGCPYTNTCAMVDTESDGVMKQIKDHKVSLRDFFKTILEDELGQSDEVTELSNQIFVIYSGSVTEAQNLRDLWPVESARGAIVALFSALKK